MKHVIVIADDLTGAAEMAGIGLRYGLATRLVVDCRTTHPSGAQLVVINADTRGQPERDAVRTVTELVSQLNSNALLFKKIDSVLRGHVAAEIEAVLAATDRFDHVLMIPQNPTRRRVILPDGQYLVEGIPLSQTTFADDPDHPARTSNVVDRLARAKRPVSLRADPAQSLARDAINIATAETFDTIQRWIGERNARTLLVGAADAFTALLVAEGFAAPSAGSAPDIRGKRLFLCGSTATPARRALRRFASEKGVEIVGADSLRGRDRLPIQDVTVVMSPEPGGVEADPREIEEALGECARRLVSEGRCDWIFAEGGATAGAVCRALGWTSLEVEAELATGVVVLKPDAKVRLVIKPGSYAWPESVTR